MSDEGGQQPQNNKVKKLPRSKWSASKSFFDLKLSNLIAILLTVALVYVGTSQLRVYLRQAKIMGTQAQIANDQLDQMRVEQRPWLRAGVSLDGPVIFTDWNGNKGVGVNLKFSIKNYGNSPAINVRIFPQIEPYLNEIKSDNLAPAQNRACAEAMRQADANPIGGFAIFPGGTATPVSYPSISGNSLFKSDPRQLFAIVGCVNYTSYADGRHGETGFRYMLGQQVGDFILGVLFQEGLPHPYRQSPSPELLAHGYPAEPPKEAKISSDQFIFEPKQSGNYAK